MNQVVSTICKKRLIGDIKLLKKEPLEFIAALMDEKDMLHWYFMIKGPEFSDFSGGYYLGTIEHNKDYPFKPPDFKMLTPNGRFTVGTKICMSNTGYHSDEWSAMWNIRAILTGFLSIMLDDKEHGISHIHSSKEERISFAKQSVEFNKKNYPDVTVRFHMFVDKEGNPTNSASKTNVAKPVVDPVVAKPINDPIIAKPVNDQVVNDPIIVKPVVNDPVIEVVKSKAPDEPIADKPIVQKRGRGRPKKNIL